MKLMLDRDDLKDQYKALGSVHVDFEHFKPEVQEAIARLGKATFKTFRTQEIHPVKHDASKFRVSDLVPGRFVADASAVDFATEWPEIILVEIDKIHVFRQSSTDVYSDGSKRNTCYSSETSNITILIFNDEETS